MLVRHLARVCLFAGILWGCANEEPGAHSESDVSDATDTVDDAHLVETDADATLATDPEATSDSEAMTDSELDVERDPLIDAQTDTAPPCEMGNTASDNGCPCETHRLQCCWGGVHIECVAPPGESYSAWTEVHDADWNCDEFPDCEDFEGVPPP